MSGRLVCVRGEDGTQQQQAQVDLQRRYSATYIQHAAREGIGRGTARLLSEEAVFFFLFSPLSKALSLGRRFPVSIVKNTSKKKNQFGSPDR